MSCDNCMFLPTYQVGIDEFSDGRIIHLTEYCLKKNNTKCQNYYKKIFENNEGLCVCPYGFNSYVYRDGDKVDIFTGFRVKGKFNDRKANSKIKKTDNNLVISEEQLTQYIEEYKCYLKLYYEKNCLDKFVPELVHDIRKYNATIKTKSYQIINQSNNRRGKNKEINEYGLSIKAMSEYITSRLDIYNYLYAGKSLKDSEPSDVNFFNIFDKLRKCLNEVSRDKNITINLECYGECSYLKLYESAEHIPFLILDNAIKYTTFGEQINIKINDDIYKQEIILQSYGVKIDDNEKEKIFERGYRGKHAKDYCNDGSGIGLYFLKQVCDANNLIITIDSEYIDGRKSKNDALFTLKICYNK